MRFRVRGTGWRLARSLVTLGKQISEAWPDGGPTDGTVGDLSHQSRRSDHNPNAAGVVTALDSDEVIEDRGQMLVDQLVASRDPRIKYIIHEGRIWRSYDKPGIPAWTPGDYSGPNAHLSHVHISVSSDPALYDDPSPWALELGDEMPPTLKIGDTGLTVELYQTAIVRWQPNIAELIGEETFKVDAAFGPKTRKAIQYYQKQAQLVAPFVANPDPFGEIGGVTAANLSRYVTVPS